MDELKTLRNENNLLKQEIVKIRKLKVEYEEKIKQIEIYYNHLKESSQTILMSSIEMAYKIKEDIKKMLESLKGKTYEEGIAIIVNFVKDNKHFFGFDFANSKSNVDVVVNKILKQF